ncbi:hypothetical protein HYW44_00285 [Candidatus Daviesbacteria bacterium]|nr:hypothetical protein [Candidatus Daviesbacteria bacterium]
MLLAKVESEGPAIKLLEYEVNPDDRDLISTQVLRGEQINTHPLVSAVVRYVK